VVTGPTGSGKSTTLAAMIDLINKSRSDHIITIEDPVEFVHQSQKLPGEPARGAHAHRVFRAALRAALREDPDIVLVGEMRDLETVSIAIETAETGHLVFGTLHTNTAVSTVDRIIDQFPTDRQAQIRVMLSESLKGVVAQTLCKKIGGGRVAALEILVVQRGLQPDPRGQDLPDPVDHADRGSLGAPTDPTWRANPSPQARLSPPRKLTGGGRPRPRNGNSQLIHRCGWRSVSSSFHSPGGMKERLLRGRPATLGKPG
jgi:nucleoside-triphosphatase THEP1